MQPSPPTVHLLVAFHALTHRLSLGEPLKSEVERQGARAYARALALHRRSSSRGRPRRARDAGRHRLRRPGAWLARGRRRTRIRGGVRGRRGRCPSSATGACSAPLAEAIANADGPEHVRDLVSHAWASRAVRLMDGLPKTAGAVVEALDWAIKGCPWSPMRRRSLFESMALASEALGDWGRAQAARDFVHRLDEEDALAYVAAQTLLTLWCITHDELLLSSERGLDPGIEPSPEGWARVREAVEAGRPDDVPAPVGTFAGWSRNPGNGLEEYVLRIALQMHAPLLADMARAVENPARGRRAAGVALV